MEKQLAIPEPQDLSTWTDTRLDNAIGRMHVKAGRFMDGYEAAATLTGVLLRERKLRLGTRKFSPWVEENFDGSLATAKRYVELADTHAPIRVTDEPDKPSLTSSNEATKPAEEEAVSEDDTEVVETLGADTDTEIVCPTCQGFGRIPRNSLEEQ